MRAITKLRHRLGAIALAVLLAVTGGAYIGRTMPDAAAAQGCGAQSTGNGAQVVTTWRIPGGCDSIGYAWQDKLVGRSPSGVYTAIFQADGNLVVYRHGSTPMWHSNSYGNPLARIIFQYDGNMVIYKDGCPNCVAWAANPYFGAYGPMQLVMQDDANLVIYNGNHHPYWSWQTGVLYQ